MCKEVAENKPLPFDLLGYFENTSCSNIYNYAYPDKQYSKDKGLIAIYCLTKFITVLYNVFNHVQLSDEHLELKTILSTSNDKLEIMFNKLNDVSTDYSIQKGHNTLSDFITNWASFKELTYSSIKSYFEKQNLIHDYNSKLEQIKNNNESSVITPNKDALSTVIINEQNIEQDNKELSIIFVKKIKSLL